MQRQQIWDPLVRVFHWSLVTLFTLNAFVTDPESRLHRLVGYAVLGLLAVRVLWGFIGTAHARFSSFPPSAAGSFGQFRDMLSGRRRAHAGHSPLGALMIYNLLVSIAVISVSGWMMVTNRWWGIEWVEDLHEAAVTWAELSVLVHVAAVFFESRRLGINLPKSMVTGYKDMPPDSQVKVRRDA